MKFEISQESILLLVVALFLAFLVNATSSCVERGRTQKMEYVR
jgi:hypothetical protein